MSSKLETLASYALDILKSSEVKNYMPQVNTNARKNKSNNASDRSKAGFATANIVDMKLDSSKYKDPQMYEMFNTLKKAARCPFALRLNKKQKKNTDDLSTYIDIKTHVEEDIKELSEKTDDESISQLVEKQEQLELLNKKLEKIRENEKLDNESNLDYRQFALQILYIFVKGNVETDELYNLITSKIHPFASTTIDTTSSEKQSGYQQRNFNQGGYQQRRYSDRTDQPQNYNNGGYQQRSYNNNDQPQSYNNDRQPRNYNNDRQPRNYNDDGQQRNYNGGNQQRRYNDRNEQSQKQSGYVPPHLRQTNSRPPRQSNDFVEYNKSNYKQQNTNYVEHDRVKTVINYKKNPFDLEADFPEVKSASVVQPVPEVKTTNTVQTIPETNPVAVQTAPKGAWAKKSQTIYVPPPPPAEKPIEGIYKPKIVQPVIHHVEEIHEIESEFDDYTWEASKMEAEREKFYTDGDEYYDPYNTYNEYYPPVEQTDEDGWIVAEKKIKKFNRPIKTLDSLESDPAQNEYYPNLDDQPSEW